jgi:hypothetical protein
MTWGELRAFVEVALDRHRLTKEERDNVCIVVQRQIDSTTTVDELGYTLRHYGPPDRRQAERRTTLEIHT